MRLVAIAALVCTVASFGAAEACTIVDPTMADFLANKRVRQKADCSFANAGVYDERAGEAAQDLGNQRVMQRLNSDEVVLTDCAAGSAVRVLGKADPANETSCGPDYELQKFETPNGPVDYTVGADLGRFISLMAEGGFLAIEVGDMNEGERSKDVVDYFCGCKFFYPESAAAREE